jgi:hypothetical protein
MSFGRSGALDPARYGRARSARAKLVTGAALLGLLVACAGDRTPAPSGAACTGLPDCPIELRFVRAGADDVATVAGELSPERPSMSYAFQAPARSRLQWSLQGPVVRTTLAGPDGDVIGPGLPAHLPLQAAGRYVFSLSSNTMAEGIYGPFRLELRLSPSD